MPELPEVETTKRGIKPHIQNQSIIRSIVRQPKLRWPVSDEITTLNDVIITDVTRRSKYLLLHLSTGATLIAHLGMSGSISITEPDTPAGFHDHLDLVLSNRKILRYTDPRRFGCWLYTDMPIEQHPLITKLGPEPLSEAFIEDHLYHLSRSKKVKIKNFIMDNHIVVGVGNIYANEALYLAGISPNRAAGNISKQRLSKLQSSIREVLTKAIAAGGTTLQDFVGSDGKPGYFQQQLNVYGRAGLPCLSCANKLKEVRLGGRATVYCTHCQK